MVPKAGTSLTKTFVSIGRLDWWAFHTTPQKFQLHVHFGDAQRERGSTFCNLAAKQVMTMANQHSSEEHAFISNVATFLREYPSFRYRVFRDLEGSDLGGLRDLAYENLSSEKYTVTLVAASALAAWGYLDEKVRSILEQAMDLDGDPEFQVIGAAALARAHDVRAIPCLLSLRDDGQFGITTLAYDTLCIIGHEDTIRLARTMVRDPELALFASTGLVRIGELAVLPMLQEKLNDGACFEIVRSLEGLGYAIDKHSYAIALIQPFCANEYPGIRHAAYLALARLSPIGSREREALFLSSWHALIQD